MARPIAVLLACSSLFAATAAFAQNDKAHNLILFVPDGLRALKVTPETAPAMAELRDKGVNFKNPHSLFPTFTTANASALSTGHYLGDTGDFSNTIYTGYPVAPDATPWCRSSRTTRCSTTSTALLRQLSRRGHDPEARPRPGLQHGGHRQARPDPDLRPHRQPGTPALHYDRGRRPDRQQGRHAAVRRRPGGDDQGRAAARRAGRGDNGKAGGFETPVPRSPTSPSRPTSPTSRPRSCCRCSRRATSRSCWWCGRATRRPQHNQGDSLGNVVPGINGPTSLAAIKNADDNLAQLREALTALGLADTTDIIIAADHGFSTISKESKTSPRRRHLSGHAARLAADGLCRARSGKVARPSAVRSERQECQVADNAYPKAGNGVIGNDPAKPDMVIAANGGSDLVYLPGNDKKLAAHDRRVPARAGLRQRSVRRRRSWPFPARCRCRRDQHGGQGVTPHPAMCQLPLLAKGCDEPLLCTVEVADTVLQQGQGMHGNFSRADTMNFMAAIGPDFKGGFADDVTGQQRRHRHDRARCSISGEAQGQPDRPGDDRSDAKRHDAARAVTHTDVAAGAGWLAHRAELSDRRHAALFR